MSMYEDFETSTNLEESGVWLDFPTFRVLIARAGGANKKFTKELLRLTKPFQSQIAQGNMPKERADKLVSEAYARASILDWNVLVDEEGNPLKSPQGDEDIWARGIHARDGSILDFTQENVQTTLLALPALFNQIQNHAENYTTYLDAVDEAVSGN